MAASAIVVAVVNCVLDSDDDDEFDVRNIQAAMHNIEYPESKGTDVDDEIFRNLRTTGGHFMLFSPGVDQESMTSAIRKAETDARAYGIATVGSATYRNMLNCSPLTRDCPVAHTIATATKSWGQYLMAIQSVPVLSLDIVGQSYDYTVVRIDTAWNQAVVNHVYQQLLEIHDRLVLAHRYKNIDYVTMVSNPMFHPAARFPSKTTKPGVSCCRWGAVFVHPGIVARVFGHKGVSIKNKIDQVRKIIGEADGRLCQQPMAIPVKGALSGAMMMTFGHMQHMSPQGCKRYISEMYGYIMKKVRVQIRGAK